MRDMPQGGSLSAVLLAWGWYLQVLVVIVDDILSRVCGVAIIMSSRSLGIAAC